MAILIEDGDESKVFFGVKVSKLRAEYLFKCLQRPLCMACGREEDECSADPCPDVRIQRGEIAYCRDCLDYYDPAALIDGYCPDCSKE